VLELMLWLLCTEDVDPEATLCKALAPDAVPSTDPDADVALLSTLLTEVTEPVEVDELADWPMVCAKTGCEIILLKNTLMSMARAKHFLTLTRTGSGRVLGKSALFGVYVCEIY